MICVVLHCDWDGCDREQGYPVSTLSQHRRHGTFFDTALRLGGETGWLFLGNGKGLPDFDVTVICPQHAVQANDG